MSKDPTQLIAEIGTKIEAMKEDNEKVTSLLKDSTQATAEEVKTAIAKAEALATKIEEQAGSILSLEQRLAEDVISGKASPKSLGDIIIEAEAFTEFAKGNTQKMRVEANTITGQEGSPPENSDTLVPAQRQSGIVPGAFRNLRVADLMPVINVSSNAYEYTRELLFTNNAAETEEAAQKPESVLTFELVTENIRTIPTFIKASKQILDDAPALRSYIDTRLRYAVDYRMDSQLVNGTGVGQNIAGILKTGNHTVFSPVTGEKQLDSLNRAQAQVQAAEYEGTGYIMNPADWHAIERLKVGTSDDRYVVGNPLGVIGRILWGKPVALSNAVPSGKFIYANFDIAYSILNRMGTVVEMFEQDEDNVQKNLLTIRAEKRGALASQRPASSVAGLLVVA